MKTPLVLDTDMHRRWQSTRDWFIGVLIGLAAFAIVAGCIAVVVWRVLRPGVAQ